MRFNFLKKLQLFLSITSILCLTFMFIEYWRNDNNIFTTLFFKNIVGAAIVSIMIIIAKTISENKKGGLNL